VEDEGAVRTIVSKILQNKGYTVLEAHHGPEALEICQVHEGPIHLMVTDVVMPHMSGRELAERLTILRPELRVLFMSGYPDNAIVHHGVLGAGTAFLQKPFTLNALEGKVRELLDAPPQTSR
jgi:CheY-like chemotaxis protein